MPSWLSPAYRSGAGSAPSPSSHDNATAAARRAPSLLLRPMEPTRSRVPLTALIVPVQGLHAPPTTPPSVPDGVIGDMDGNHQQQDTTAVAALLRSAYAFARFRAPALHAALVYDLVIKGEASEGALGNEPSSNDDANGAAARRYGRIADALKEIRGGGAESRAYVSLSAKDLLPPVPFPPPPAAPTTRGGTATTFRPPAPSSVLIEPADALLLALRVTMKLDPSGLDDRSSTAELFRVCLVHAHACPPHVLEAWAPRSGLEGIDPRRSVVCWIEVIAPQRSEPIVVDVVAVPRALDPPSDTDVATALGALQRYISALRPSAATDAAGGHPHRPLSEAGEQHRQPRQRRLWQRPRRGADQGGRFESESSSSSGDDVSSGPFSREINALPPDVEAARTLQAKRAQEEAERAKAAEMAPLPPSPLPRRPPWQLHTPPVTVRSPTSPSPTSFDVRRRAHPSVATSPPLPPNVELSTSPGPQQQGLPRPAATNAVRPSSFTHPVPADRTIISAAAGEQTATGVDKVVGEENFVLATAGEAAQLESSPSQRVASSSPSPQRLASQQAALRAEVDAAHAEMAVAHGSVALWSPRAVPSQAAIDRVLANMSAAANRLAAAVDAMATHVEGLLACVALAESAVSERKEAWQFAIEFQHRQDETMRRMQQAQTMIKDLHYSVYSFQLSLATAAPPQTAAASTTIPPSQVGT